jgi:hypothetical protein
MAYSFRFEDPEKAGTLIRERVRCGRPNCHCASRKTFHYAWYLRYRDYRRPDKKQRKKYINKEQFQIYQMILPLGRLNDKHHKLNMQQKLVLMHKAMGEEYDYEADWRTWILRSSDFTPEQKWKVMHDIPLIDEVESDRDDWKNWVCVPTYLENGNMRLTAYRRDELELFRRVAAGEQLFSSNPQS